MMRSSNIIDKAVKRCGTLYLFCSWFVVHDCTLFGKLNDYRRYYCKYDVHHTTRYTIQYVVGTIFIYPRPRAESKNCHLVR